MRPTIHCLLGQFCAKSMKYHVNRFLLKLVTNLHLCSCFIIPLKLKLLNCGLFIESRVYLAKHVSVKGVWHWTHVRHSECIRAELEKIMQQHIVRGCRYGRQDCKINIHSAKASMVVRNKNGKKLFPNFSWQIFFQLCNVEAPTLIINGLLIGWKQTKHSAGLIIRFLGSAKISTIFHWVWV